MTNDDGGKTGHDSHTACREHTEVDTKLTWRVFSLFTVASVCAGTASWGTAVKASPSSLLVACLLA